jgi:hypothetical protein
MSPLPYMPFMAWTGMALPTQHWSTRGGDADEWEHVLYNGVYSVMHAYSINVRFPFAETEVKFLDFLTNLSYNIVHIQYHNQSSALKTLFDWRLLHLCETWLHSACIKTVIPKIHLTTNNCTIELKYHLKLPYICFGHYTTIIRGIYIFMFSLHCALSTFLLFN